jgi:hypothetical protein
VVAFSSSDTQNASVLLFASVETQPETEVSVQVPETNPLGNRHSIEWPGRQFAELLEEGSTEPSGAIAARGTPPGLRRRSRFETAQPRGADETPPVMTDSLNRALFAVSFLPPPPPPRATVSEGGPVSEMPAVPLTPNLAFIGPVKSEVPDGLSEAGSAAEGNEFSNEPAGSDPGETALLEPEADSPANESDRTGHPVRAEAPPPPVQPAGDPFRPPATTRPDRPAPQEAAPGKPMETPPCRAEVEANRNSMGNPVGLATDLESNRRGTASLEPGHPAPVRTPAVPWQQQMSGPGGRGPTVFAVWVSKSQVNADRAFPEMPVNESGDLAEYSQQPHQEEREAGAQPSPILKRADPVESIHAGYDAASARPNATESGAGPLAVASPFPDLQALEDGERSTAPDRSPPIWETIDAGAPPLPEPSTPARAVASLDVGAPGLEKVSVRLVETPDGVEVQVAASDPEARQQLLGGMEELSSRFKDLSAGVVIPSPDRSEADLGSGQRHRQPPHRGPRPSRTKPSGLPFTLPTGGAIDGSYRNHT